MLTNINGWLKQAETKLNAAGIATVRLDCLVLLEDATGKDRAYILAHPEFELPEQTTKKLNRQISRRSTHEPLAYIRDKTEFYGREFVVSPDTLEPRPESEAIIDILKKHVRPIDKITLVDVGTGSGALAITAKIELPNISVWATEISAPALKIAKQNALDHKVSVKFFRGNLLEPVTTKIDIVIANLPYVPNDHTINKAARHEPDIAIFGGPDGLDLYRKLFTQVGARLIRPQYILTESLPPQHAKLADIASQVGYTQKTEDDFIQVFTR